MPHYRGTYQVIKVHEFQFEEEAANPDEARQVMSDEDHTMSPEECATNDWDESVFTLYEQLIDLHEIPAVSDWSIQGFISWGQYLIAAIECGWREDKEAAIAEFTEKYGRRDSKAQGDLDGYPCDEEP